VRILARRERAAGRGEGGEGHGVAM
jgi:hypothetical protein